MKLIYSSVMFFIFIGLSQLQKPPEVAKYCYEKGYVKKCFKTIKQLKEWTTINTMANTGIKKK